MQTCYLYRRVQNSSNTVNRSKGCLIFEWPQSINTSSVILAAGSVTHFARKYVWKHRQLKIWPDEHSIRCAVDPLNILHLWSSLFWGRLRFAGKIQTKLHTHTHMLVIIRLPKVIHRRLFFINPFAYFRSVHPSKIINKPILIVYKPSVLSFLCEIHLFCIISTVEITR